jgi:PBP1b-binding outer membrane lipoprotein LpoB
MEFRHALVRFFQQMQLAKTRRRKALKSRILIVVIAVAALALVFAGCKKGEQTPPPGTEQATGQPAPAPTGKMTDQALVEIMANQMCYNGVYGPKIQKAATPEEAQKLTAELNAKMQEVFNKFGVTPAEFTAYHDQLVQQNPENLAKLTDMATKMAEELKKTVK